LAKGLAQQKREKNYRVFFKSVLKIENLSVLIAKGTTQDVFLT
jgi:hypothetical protein